MNIPITSELQSICQQIVRKDMNLEEWSAVESDDEFQSKNFCGGFDADESAFCFSYFNDSREYWFQFSIEEASQIATGGATKITGRLSES